MSKCKHYKKNIWLVVGVITGYILGFSYFAIGVYTHTKNKTQMRASNVSSDYEHAGITK